MQCDHTDVIWAVDGDHINEAAWQCFSCGNKLGFRPDLDRSHIYDKVRGILNDFHESKLIYISNGTMGDIVADNVTHRCKEENMVDQWTILRFILEDPNLIDHGVYWQAHAKEWLTQRGFV